MEEKFAKIMQPHKSQYAYPRPLTHAPGLTAAGAAGLSAVSPKVLAPDLVGEPMDIPSRLRAIKVFNVILARLWRRRRAEVSDLRELVSKYQWKANAMRDDLFMRNKLICREQRRYERLESELRRVQSGAELSSRGRATIEKALEAARCQEVQLRKDLQDKTLECSNLGELLSNTRTDMFRELAKFRKCAQELADQQRQNSLLEMRNAELEDKLLTLKDQFQTQHDDIVVAVHMKQEQLNEAYEMLKGYEQDLAELELKHMDLLKENQEGGIQQDIGKVEQKIGLMRYMIYFITTHRWRHWPNFKSMANQLAATFLDYILNHSPLPILTLPVTSVSLFLGSMLLIDAMY